jgi:arginase
MIRSSPVERLAAGTVAIVGVPWDTHSSFRRGAAAGPPRIREALASESGNLWTENGLDLGTDPRMADAGDIAVAREDGAIEDIERGLGAILGTGAHALVLGGDHAITYPVLRAHSRVRPRLTVLHIDAHPDLYDEFEGDRLSHACPFARVMEEGLVTHLLQIGIRTMNDHQREQARRFGVQVVEMKDWHVGSTPSIEGDVYLSLDLDALDPAFAPGVSHHEPGGFSPRDLIGLIQRFGGRLVGADVVELNPSRDPLGITAMAAAKLVKELAGRMLADQPSTGHPRRDTT